MLHNDPSDSTSRPFTTKLLKGPERDRAFDITNQRSIVSSAASGSHDSGIFPRETIDMRVAILWIELTGYLNACLRELASRPGVEIFVAHTPASSNSPFDADQFRWVSQQLAWRSSSELDSLEARLNAFQPDVIVFAGWSVPAYRKVAKRWKRRATRIMTMDNCWMGTAAQRVRLLDCALLFAAIGRRHLGSRGAPSCFCISAAFQAERDPSRKLFLRLSLPFQPYTRPVLSCNIR